MHVLTTWAVILALTTCALPIAIVEANTEAQKRRAWKLTIASGVAFLIDVTLLALMYDLGPSR